MVRDASVLVHRRVPLQGCSPHSRGIVWKDKRKCLSMSTRINKKFDPGAWISQEEAARFRGVRPQTIASFVKRGRLTSIMVAGRRLVRRSEIESFDSRPLGRPSKRQEVSGHHNQVSSALVNDDWISQADAAKLRGVSRQAISSLLKRKRLTAVKMAGRTLVLRSEVEAFEKISKFDLPPQRAKTKPNPDKRKKR